jgi:hypothetical protein
MPNTLIFTVDSITSDRLQGVLLDGSVYTDPVRSGAAVFVKGQKMLATGSVESTLTVTGDQANPETDSEWVFNIPKDGWFRFLIVSVPDFNTSNSYSIYDSVFDPFTAKVYRSKQNSNTTDNLLDTSWWEEITDPATLASNEGETNESDNIDSLIYEPGVLPNSEYGFANQIADASEEYLTSLNIPDDDLERYSLLSILVDGAYVKSDRSEMNQAERIARRLESILETFEQ